MIGCDWRDCGESATVRLWFGGRNVHNGHPVPGVNYCDAHAARVRVLFRVRREEPPAKSDAGLHRRAA